MDVSYKGNTKQKKLDMGENTVGFHFYKVKKKSKLYF